MVAILPKMIKPLQAAAIVGAIVFFTWILSIGWSKNEVVECHKWLAESREFSLWYSTNWQREQCKAHGLELPEGYKP